MFPFGGDLASTLQQLAISIPALLLALAFHEFSHAWVATRLGDTTPEADGRLTMNPIAHLDPIGALMLVFVGFGWAKPVQVHGQNFKNPLRDMAVVAAAGPVSNVLLAVALALVLKGMLAYGVVDGPVFGALFAMVRVGFFMNIGLAIFNLLPIPPLDGSRILVWLLPRGPAEAVARLEPYAPLILIGVLVTGIHRPFLRPMYGAVVGAIRWGVGL
jgi:Zn-dependent protease